MEIDEPFVQWLLKLRAVISHLANNSASKEFREGSELLGQFIGRAKSVCEKERGAFLQGLAAEYASLFLNVGLKHVYLVESVYIGKNHLLYEEPYFDVVRIYQIFRFKKRVSFSQPEDHVSVELEFMAHLCDLAVLSIEQGKQGYAAGYLENQKQFLETHLARWVPELVKNVIGASTNDFYLAMASLLRGFMTTDKPLVSRFAEGLHSTGHLRDCERDT